LLPSVATAIVVAVLSGNAATEADQDGLVANTAIDGPALTFDWPAIEVGIGSYEEAPTGVTVIRFPKRVAGGRCPRRRAGNGEHRSAAATSAGLGPVFISVRKGSPGVSPNVMGEAF
jgi:hypothetical protein